MELTDADRREALQFLLEFYDLPISSDVLYGAMNALARVSAKRRCQRERYTQTRT